MTPLSNVRVVGIDPGKRCGFATLRDGVFTSCEYAPYDACRQLEFLLSEDQFIGVAIERFTFQATSNKKTRQYDALEIIGTARYLCAK